MARRLNRGDIHLHDFGRLDKRRPVVILTDDGLIPYLTYVTVAPITPKVRGNDAEVLLSVEDGMKDVCSVKLNNLVTVEQQLIGPRIGSLSNNRMEQICRAIRFALGCQHSGENGADGKSSTAPQKGRPQALHIRSRLQASSRTRQSVQTPSHEPLPNRRRRARSFLRQRRERRTRQGVASFTPGRPHPPTPATGLAVHRVSAQRARASGAVESQSPPMRHVEAPPKRAYARNSDRPSPQG